ncbi:MAG TPA: 50S ribosomal protein L30 [Longimicrobiaceae bacterium]|nr:50S ribosomal protein L30 [Longimicrobiaceae bacterium]
MARIKITQTKSGVGAPEKHRRTLAALGLKHQRSVVKEDNLAIRGMVFQVRHLVQVTELEGQENNG